MIGIVIGTRPELIKLRPVCVELKKLDVPTRIIYTGQHAAIDEEVMNLSTRVLDRPLLKSKLYPYDFGSGKPWAYGDLKAVVVQGDTDTAMQAALAAATQRIPVFHVEAGLRTVMPLSPREATLSLGERSSSPTSSSAFLTRLLSPVPQRSPFPEEMNRQLISRVASLHMAPTYANERNLCAERVGGAIAITGNPGISALAHHLEGLRPEQRTPKETTILVTCHRRENWPHIYQLCIELTKVAAVMQALEVVLVRHPNEALYENINTPAGCGNYYHLPPTRWDAMVNFLLKAKLVVTDSGGLLEEATWLGKRRLVLRSETERPEACAPLIKKIEGCHEDILEAIDQPLPSEGSRYAFGDEKSAANCAKLIAQHYKELS